jgi:tRNA threonylcarbamoyladenosine modification (KEOPS) complex  Pcc1 subunit
MEVDEELTDKSAKVLRTEGSTLVVDFYAADLKMLRIATSSFFDMIQVSVKTLLEFDKDQA